MPEQKNHNQLDENYARAYQGRLGFGQRPVLLVVDMVQAYFEPACPLYAEVDRELAVTIKLIDAAREASVPVIYTNVVFHESGVNGGMFFKKAPVLENFCAGNPMGEWPAGIAPRQDELVISKQYPSAFFGTTLAATLTALQIDSVVTCGVTTRVVFALPVSTRCRTDLSRSLSQMRAAIGMPRRMKQTFLI